MIKNILWDVDGTLLDFEKTERFALKKCLADIGAAADDAAAARYSRINDAYWKRLERGECSRAEVAVGRFRDFFAAEGISADPAAFDAAYKRALCERQFLNDDCAALCDELGEYVRQFVVTNGSAAVQYSRLRSSGLYYVMNGVFISEEIGFEKPSAEFFDTVLSVIGPEEKDETVIIGDSLSGDMLGGVNAGILCWWYNPRGEKNLSGVRVDREIRDLREVLALIRSERGEGEDRR
ncbi:MAG: YjjG family noncanonical pyrimidine nucleotidase [Oscillospiraceae bacterium]|nr:YjjG family noncanonical pyrimidine nucleotidase [Oscillospiraceae bacterium]